MTVVKKKHNDHKTLYIVLQLVFCSNEQMKESNAQIVQDDKEGYKQNHIDDFTAAHVVVSFQKMRVNLGRALDNRRNLWM